MKHRQQSRGRARFIISHMKGCVSLFVLAALFSVFNTAFGALTPQIIKITVDSVIGDAPFALPAFLRSFLRADVPGGFRHSLLFWAAAVLAVSALAGVSSFLFRLHAAKGAERFIKSLRDALFRHIQRLPFAWHMRHQTGEIIQRCTSDVRVIHDFVSTQLLEVFRTCLLVTFSMAIMFSMNLKISLAALVFLPGIVLYSAIFYSNIAKKFRDADEAEGALSSVVQENLTGVRVVRAFGRENYEIERFDTRNNNFSNFWIKLGYVQSYYWGLGDLITGLQIMTVLILGVTEAVNGAITLGEFLAFLSYNTTLVWPVRELGRILSEMSKTGVSIDRVRYILESSEEEDAPGAREVPMDKDIRFEHVRFSYGAAMPPVLDGIDLTIPAGSTFAILGGTGEGKSTLMHLLDRLYELPEGCGKITIGGVDLKEISRAHVRRNVGMVLQEPFLFSRTIRENIAAACPEATDEEIAAAARVACVDEAIREFHSGYDTIVGERGVTLSGGQKQRVAIARMLLQKAKILIFDDSLSAVDAQTDSQIRAALKEQMGKATVILISHRITTLMQADCIAVLENGRIAESGTHDDLLRKNGIYKQIYDIQMSSDDRLFLEREEQDGSL